MTSCPVCQKPVDTLRARFVAVRDGKVVAFCSAEHLAQGGGATPAAGVPTRATPPAGAPKLLDGDKAGPPRPATPAPGVPVSLESGPVITIESSGVPRSDASEPRAKHPDEISMAAFWNADKERKDRTGPVAIPTDKTGPAAAVDKKTSPVTAVDKKTGPVAAVDKKTGPVAAVASKSAADSADELPAVAHDTEPARRSRLPLVLAVLVVLGAGGFALYRFVLAPSGAIEQLPRPQVQLPEPPPPPAPTSKPFWASDAVLERAKIALRGFLVGTPRISRLAAAALSRTGSEGRDVLAAQLGLPGTSSTTVETSEIGRLDMAYALARSGDPRGTPLLVTALSASRGDVRDEAARLLALLHDKRAIPHLLDLLAVPQRRMAAAESLARLVEPHGLAALTAMRADPKASPDDKMRATIALGAAGQRDLSPALHAMLDDPHFNIFAAAALAELGDKAALRVLSANLGSRALGVYAARALRRLAPKLEALDNGHDHDAWLLDPLTIDANARDIDQIATAEAALLALGDAAWSTYE